MNRIRDEKGNITTYTEDVGFRETHEVISISIFNIGVNLYVS